jgi:hypothetical protein
MNKKIKRILIVVGIAVAVITIGAAIVGLMALNQLKQIITTPSTPLGLEALPCEPKSQVELGSPYQMNGQVAEFTTSGDKLYITARRFPHSGFSGSSPGSTAIFMGDSSALPEYDSQRDTTTNTVKTISLSETKYAEFELPAGRYWLWSSSGGDVVIYSCEEGGVSDPKPVWR